MPQKTSPFLEGKWGWNLGEGGWNSGADENWLKFSYMFDANVDAIVSTLPVAVNGEAYFLTTDNRIYFVVDGTYYNTPVPKWFEFKIKSTGVVYVFDGSTVSILPSGQQAADTLEAKLANASDPSQGAALWSYKGRNGYQKFEETLSVRDYITTQIDGVTSNQAGIVAAVADAKAQGKDLHWPAGTYVSDANIPDFHSVRHFGRGVLKRDTTTFVIQPKGKATTTNTLYITNSGNNANDGLTSALPFATLQAALDALVNAGDYHCGRWRIELAAGVYVQSGTIDSVGFRNRLVIAGPDVSGDVPTAIIDGTGISTTYLSALTLSGGLFAQVKDIKFTNWTGASGVGSGGANTGVTATDRANVWVDNCDFVNCDTAVGATNSRIYQGRGRVTDCGIGSTAFASSQCSYGYGGATIYTNCTIGANIRDSSSGVVDAGTFDTCGIGVRVQYGSVARVSNCAFSSSVTCDVYCYTGGSVFFGDGNTYTPGKKFRGQNSLDLGNAGQIYFASTAALLCVESPNPQIALNGSATAFAGLQVAVPTLSQVASFLYSHADGNWRFRCNDVDAYRMHPTTFRPATDNVPSLGLPAARFTVVYAATGTINTSDERSKQQIKPIDEACLRAWAKAEYVQYKFNDAVEAKGDGARWHFGLIAQRVKEAFESEGLDAFEYGVLCYDEWPEQPEVKDDEGNVTQEYRAAGDRYGIRYEEALALEVALMRHEMVKLKAQLG